MAVYVSHPAFIAVHPDLATVLIKPEALPWDRGRESHPPVLDDMLRWLKEIHREGAFAYRCDTARKQATLYPMINGTITRNYVEIEYVREAKFYFNNPNTAFEFKMRWA